MGTRNLCCAVIDGEMKIAQYGQWDGYPEGQGVDCCEFIQSLDDLEAFRSAVRECRQITQEEWESHWREIGVTSLDDSTYDDKRIFKSRYPWLSRDAGAKVFGYVRDGARLLKVYPSFAADGLFCEWVYVLDLDSEALEVYEGFQKEPHTDGRFHDMDRPEDVNSSYYPARLLHTIPFSEIREHGKNALLGLFVESEPNP